MLFDSRVIKIGLNWFDVRINKSTNQQIRGCADDLR